MNFLNLPRVQQDSENALAIIEDGWSQQSQEPEFWLNKKGKVLEESSNSAGTSGKNIDTCANNSEAKPHVAKYQIKEMCSINSDGDKTSEQSSDKSANAGCQSKASALMEAVVWDLIKLLKQDRPLGKSIHFFH